MQTRMGSCRVVQLKKVIANAELTNEDILVVNQVGNLTVVRNDKEIGYIQLGNYELNIISAEFYNMD
jgi:hypothetical protein